MKYVVILGDGMADYHQESLNNKTPLMVAKKPNIDKLAKSGIMGLVRTVPLGMKPGSDVANLSVLGYNPEKGYTGRSPLEAASIGINLTDTDVAARANLVTLSGEEKYADKTMVDYSAGEISTAEARELINYLKEHLDNEECSLYSGVSYRHCLVIKNGRIAGDVVPPHDITGRKIFNYLPKSIEGRKRLSIMEKSHELLKDHPINQRRVKEGKNPANSLWLWGEGTRPNLQNFEERFNLKGAIISAVDLLKGIGKIVGMQVVEVEGATGNYDTNFSGKAEACVSALKNGVDFVYVHIEAPDECGHHGDIEKKIYSIEQIDEKVVKPIVGSLEEMGEDFAVLVAPDHPTPVSTMTHCSDPVPFLIYKSKYKNDVKEQGYDEEQAEKTGLFVSDGYNLIKMLIND